jgi:hypothetical protein
MTCVACVLHTARCDRMADFRYVHSVCLPVAVDHPRTVQVLCRGTTTTTCCINASPDRTALMNYQAIPRPVLHEWQESQADRPCRSPTMPTHRLASERAWPRRRTCPGRTNVPVYCRERECVCVNLVQRLQGCGTYRLCNGNQIA